MTPGPMRVGWARIDGDPGYQIGSDENSWAFDGFNVSFAKLKKKTFNLLEKLF